MEIFTHDVYVRKIINQIGTSTTTRPLLLIFYCYRAVLGLPCSGDRDLYIYMGPPYRGVKLHTGSYENVRAICLFLKPEEFPGSLMDDP